MAAEEDVLLREVDEDLSRDQQMAAFRRYQTPIAAGAIAIVAAVAGYQFYTSNKAAAAAAAAERYAELSFAADTPASPETLTRFAYETDTGYAALAALRAAAAIAADGDLEAAAGLYAQVYENPSVSVAMRDFARVRAAYTLFDVEPSEAAGLVAAVETEAFRPFADEIAAGAALSSGSFAAAKAGYTALADNPDAPQSLRSRAQSYAAVADAGANGASLKAPVSSAEVNSFIEQFGAQLGSAGIPVGGADAEDLLAEVPTPDLEAAVADAETETSTDDADVPDLDSEEDNP